jgi:Arc/MetJ family transcription regulator
MRTTLDLDDALMRALLLRLPGHSKTQAIEAAVHAYLAEGSASRLRALAGTLEVEDLSDDLRRRDRRS